MHEKGYNKTCGGYITMAKPYAIRDKVYEVKLYDHGFVFKKIPIYANTEEDAIRYFRQIENLPKHTHFSIRLVSGDNDTISES